MGNFHVLNTDIKIPKMEEFIEVCSHSYIVTIFKLTASSVIITIIFVLFHLLKEMPCMVPSLNFLEDGRISFLNN